jgi:HD-like signal output (HDOD) protein
VRKLQSEEVIPLVDTENELKDIKAALQLLQNRVAQMAEPTEAAAVATEDAPAAVSKESEPDVNASEDTPVAEDAGAVGDATDHKNGADQDFLSVLRAGMSDMAAAASEKDITRAFVRLASRTKLRLLLLKRWRSGLQVVQAEGVSLPKEAFKKRPDGRAPIPLPENDLFAAVTEDRSIYAGPVPIKHFPLDLTLLLGRGARDRQIVVLPLPGRGHWTDYLFLDANHSGEKALSVAEILAQHALARLNLLSQGGTQKGGKAAALLKEELLRRQKGRAQIAESASWPAADRSAADSRAREGSPARTGPEGAPNQEPAAPQSPREPSPAAESPRRDSQRAEGSAGSTVASSRAAGNGHGLTPESIIKHSGELPALPRAACHILAVIDDPRTTATRLEKAIAMDQALTAKVLRIANSPFYGAVREIKTVSEAIVRLGFVTIRNWTMVAATKSIFLTPGAGLLFQQIWQQSVLSAMASQLVAQAVRYQEPDPVFLGGLMQNIGQLVLARAQPEVFHQIVDESARSQRPYHVVERRILGFDHGDLGAALIREWNLSCELEEAVRMHHRLSEESSEKRVAAMIALGEEIAACTGSHLANDNISWANSVSAQILGITEDLYNGLLEQARHLSIDPRFFA